jgi:hypothetical protein
VVRWQVRKRFLGKGEGTPRFSDLMALGKYENPKARELHNRKYFYFDIKRQEESK